MIADADAANLGADLLDGPCGLIARDHGQRITQRSVNPFKIGVTEPRGADAQ